MQITQNTPKYEPITIVLENRDEAEAFFDLVLTASYVTKAQLDLIRRFEAIESDRTIRF